MAVSALPAASLAAVVTVAVYCVLAARLADGTNIAVLLLRFTAPVTAAPPAVRLRVKLAALSVESVIASEKVTDTEELSVTPVAAVAGNVEETVGGVVSEVVVVGEVTTAGVNCGGCALPPPPQPNRHRLATNRLRLVSSAAEKTPAEILDLILPSDIRESLGINF